MHKAIQDKALAFTFNRGSKHGEAGGAMAPPTFCKVEKKRQGN